MPRQPKDQGLAEGQRYLGLGLKFAAGIVGFTLLGYAVDRWLGIIPMGTVTGTVLGTVLSFVSVWREIGSDGKGKPPG